ncbi:hypothetical protein ACMFMG_006073 [Clarireedia jacksonii]
MPGYFNLLIRILDDEGMPSHSWHSQAGSTSGAPTSRSGRITRSTAHQLDEAPTTASSSETQDTSMQLPSRDPSPKSFILRKRNDFPRAGLPPTSVVLAVGPPTGDSKDIWASNSFWQNA